MTCVSNLRKQIRNLPKILNFVKIIHYFSKLFTGVLGEDLPGDGCDPGEGRPRDHGQAGRGDAGRDEAAAEALVERFDIEPFSDFSVK